MNKLNEEEVYALTQHHYDQGRAVGREEGLRSATVAIRDKAAKLFVMGHDEKAIVLRDFGIEMSSLK